MADNLNTNPLVVDLNATTSRELIPFPKTISIVAIVIDGTANAAESNIELRQNNITTGPMFFQAKVPAGAVPYHRDVHFANDGIAVQGLYFDLDNAWTGGANGSVMLIYYK